MWCSNRTRVIVCALALLLFAGGGAVQAQELETSVSPTPIGAGARAAGMADAFVAIADDATASSWNPAGLVQLERPEFSIVGSWNGVRDEFRAAAFHPEASGMHNVENLDLNYFSFVYPLPIVPFDRNVTVSLSYQRKYDFTRQFTMDLNAHSGFSSTTGTTVTSLFERIEFEQKGGLSTISPALAFEITNRLSVGAALNLWRSSPFGDNSWTQKTRNRLDTLFFGNMGHSVRSTEEEYKDFTGENLTLGVLWDINDRWKLGIRYDTAFTGEADYARHGTKLSFLNGSASLLPLGKKEKRHVRFPDSLALGLSYRPNDRLTLALDATRTDWNDFLVRDSEGVRRSLVDAVDLDNREVTTDMDATYTVRFGAEYIFVPHEPVEKLDRLWTIRGGLYYDEEPATGKKGNTRLKKGDGDPDQFYGITAGIGVQLYQRVNIDAAYQYRFGNGVNSDFMRGVPGFEEDVAQHRFLLSTVVYF